MKVSHQQNDLREEQGRCWKQTAEKKAAARSENPCFMFGFQDGGCCTENQWVFLKVKDLYLIKQTFTVWVRCAGHDETDKCITFNLEKYAMVMSRNLLSEILGQAELCCCRNRRCTCAKQVAASIVDS